MADAMKMREALSEVAQTLAWQMFGECRGFSGNLLTPWEALELARKILAEQPAQGEAVAWLTPDLNRVVTGKTMAQSQRSGGATLSAIRPYSVPAYTTPPAPSVSVPIAPPAAFAEWLRGNMPPDTIISDPDWWAMAIWSAARRAINAAPVASVSRVSEPDDVAKDAARYRFLKDKLNSAKAGGGIEVNSKLQLYEKPVEGEEVRFYWYPSTPIGSYEVSAGTLDEAIDFLMLAQEPPRCTPYPLHHMTPEEK